MIRFSVQLLGMFILGAIAVFGQELIDPITMQGIRQVNGLVPSTQREDIVSYINWYRSLAKLPPVTENLSIDEGCQNHAKYMVENNLNTHEEDPDKLFYTGLGDSIGRSGLLLAATSINLSDSQSVRSLMAAPFHSMDILDPYLIEIGFGSYRAEKIFPQIQMAAVIGLRYGNKLPSSVELPIRWPQGPDSIDIVDLSNIETPDPLSGCDYSLPTGLPLVVHMGIVRNVPPTIGKHEILEDGIPVAHCILTEETYVNADVGQQSFGRAKLSTLHSIIIIPRLPLNPFKTYKVSLTINDLSYTWSFFTRYPDSKPVGVSQEGECDITDLVYPNPFTSYIRIPIQCGQSKIQRVFVSDNIGNFVVDLSKELIDQENGSILWDGLDADGVEVVAGLYWVCVVQMNGSSHIYRTVFQHNAQN